MDHLPVFLLLLLVFGLFFWRLVFVVAISMLFAFLISKTTTANTAYFSYAVLLASLAGGVLCEIRARQRFRASALSDDHR